MYEIPRKKFKEAVSEYQINYSDGFEEDRDAVRDSYSGRGMYGRTCIGVVADSPGSAVAFLFCLADQIYSDADEQRDFILDISLDMRMDSMGRSMIYYFPGYRVVDEESNV